MSILTIESMDDFEAQVLQSEKPVLVDFWATWCAPCRIMEPVLEEMAVDHPEDFKIAKVDVDKENNIGLSMKYGIRSIPTMIVFRDGNIDSQFIGVQDKGTLVDTLMGNGNIE